MSGTSHNCCVCKIKFDNQTNKTKHMKLVHQIMYKCHKTTCTKTFSTEKSRAKHEYGHNVGHRWMCTKCESVFTYKSYLISHEKIHTKEKTINCQTRGCRKCYKDKSSLNRHTAVHSTAILSCKYRTTNGCPYKTNMPKLLDDHQKSHNTTRYICNSCPKSFSYRSSL